jgi:RNA polymerase sigma-70 factor, ECF subfamily
MTKVPLPPASAKKPAPIPSAEASFARLYRECRAFVRSVLLKRGVFEREADDLVHDVFLVVWQRRDCLVSESSPRPWLHTIALYVASNHRRLARHRVEHLVSGELPEPPILPRIVQAIDAARRIGRAVRRLGRKLWSVVRAYVIDGQPMTEIARNLRIRLKTAYARLGLARQRLARLKMQYAR